MMSFDWIKPHQQLLSSQIVNRQLPHALLISGVKGAGKIVLCRWLTQSLLCQKLTRDNDQIVQPCGKCKHCELFIAGSFPDHIYVNSEKATIGVNEIRQTNQFLEKKAQLSGYKTVVIAAAQTMTESAANALLKTLEEPSDNSVLVLLSTDPERLLPTVLSRCRLMSIRPPVGGEIAKQAAIPKDIYHNLTHQNELSSIEAYEIQQGFNRDFIHFLLNKASRTLILQTLIDNEDAIRWLEKLFTDIIRYMNQWPCGISNEIAQAINNGRLTQKRIEACYKIFVQSHQQLVNLAQANKNFVIEKMLINMHSQINNH